MVSVVSMNIVENLGELVTLASIVPAFEIHASRLIVVLILKIHVKMDGLALTTNAKKKNDCNRTSYDTHSTRK